MKSDKDQLKEFLLYLCKCIYAYIYTHTFMCIWMYMYLCIFLHKCIYIYIHIYNDETNELAKDQFQEFF